MNLGLQGKVALVTGGSRGIGRAIAVTFADEGAHVAICAREQKGVDSVLTELRQRDIQAFGQVADVTQREQLEGFIHASVATLGSIDILINNVGGSKGKGLVDSSDEE